MLVASLVATGCGGATREGAIETKHALPTARSASLPVAAPPVASATRPPIHRVRIEMVRDADAGAMPPSTVTPPSSPLDVLHDEPRPSAISLGAGSRVRDVEIGGYERDEARIPPPLSPEQKAERDQRLREVDLSLVRGSVEAHCLPADRASTGTVRFRVRVENQWVDEIETLDHDGPPGFVACVEPLLFHATLNGVSERTAIVVVHLDPEGSDRRAQGR